MAQAVLVPLLVDKEAVGPSGVRAIQSMMVMAPTPDFQPGAGFVNVEAGAKLSSARGQYTPAVTAAWRMQLLARGDVPDAELACIRCAAQPAPGAGACVSRCCVPPRGVSRAAAPPGTA